MLVDITFAGVLAFGAGRRWPIRFLAVGKLPYVTSSAGQSAQKELLGQTSADALGRPDCQIPEHQPRASIRLGVVKVRNRGGGQIPA